MKKEFIASLTCAQLAFQLVAAPLLAPRAALAGDLLSVPEEHVITTRGNEYIDGNYPGAVLMPIHLWGAFPKVGIHHVPTETELTTLLSYAGGPSITAELSELKIKRTIAGKAQIIDVDLRKDMSTPEHKAIQLQPNDVVFLSHKETAVSDNTMRTLTFVSVVLAVLLSAYAVSDRIHNAPAPQ